MKIWTRLTTLSIPQAWRFLVLFLRHPLLLYPVYSATRKTFQICDALYGNAHHKSNKANAFRHALWNVLICEKSHKILKNKQKSVFWAQKVTDLYENVTQNEPMDKAMDLHNNSIGRICFLNLLQKNESEIVIFLQNRAENAQKIEKIADLKEFNNRLVYLTNSL